LQQLEGVDIVISKDDQGINAGVWLAHNTDGGRGLIAEWLGYQGRPGFTWDQEGLRDIYNHRVFGSTLPAQYQFHGVLPLYTPPQAARGFKVLRQCAMNSTPSVGADNETYMRGDFIVHFFSFDGNKKDYCVDRMANDKLMVCF
jgi:hypothetical protein